MLSIPCDNVSESRTLDSILPRPASLPPTDAADRDESFEEHLHDPVPPVPAGPAPPQAAQPESERPAPHKEESAASETEQIGGDEPSIRGKDGAPDAEQPEKEAVVPALSGDSTTGPPLPTPEVVAENSNNADEIEQPVVFDHGPTAPAANPVAADQPAAAVAVDQPAAAADTAADVLTKETGDTADRTPQTIRPTDEPPATESRPRQIAEAGPEIAVDSKAGGQATKEQLPDPDSPAAQQPARDSVPRRARSAAKGVVTEVQGSRLPAEATQDRASATPAGTGTASRPSDSSITPASSAESGTTSAASGSNDSDAGPTHRSSFSGRIPPQLLTHRGDRAAAVARSAELDQARLVQRVSRAIEAARGRGGDIRLRLSPPELGSMRLEVRVHGGALSARIEAETVAARSLLVDSLPVLRQRLAEQGIRIEQLDVDVRDPGTGGMSSEPRDSGDRTAGGMPGWDRHRTKPEPAHVDQPGVGAVVAKPQPGKGGLNVVV